ncbi:MAG: 3-phosphoshikimate 1-carboxyvinyltransferase [Actinomycetaceae bacterium]|nr:3-phosphoshikimate 1-carboxyvinyltransferase [Actinomycetaceae bacterium]
MGDATARGHGKTADGEYTAGDGGTVGQAGQPRRATVAPLGHTVEGSVSVPGSKSLTNRAIFLAMAARGASTLHRPLESDDTTFGLAAAKALGCRVHTFDGGVTIEGIGSRRPIDGGTIHVGSAGTVARFLPCFLAFGRAGEWHLHSSEQMARRPMDGLLDALMPFAGAVMPTQETGRYPLLVRGQATAGGAEPVDIAVDASVSSQYLSGILISSPLLERRVGIRTTGGIVQSAYVEMTVDYMRRFGADVEADVDSGAFTVSPRPYEPATIDIEADASTASYFAALPAVCGGSIFLPGLERHTRQPDVRFLAILEEYGCRVRWDHRGATVARPAELQRLRGGRTFDLNDCSDIALTVAALAVYADAPTRIGGVEHIRRHESDRIVALAQAMDALGLRVETHRDGWTIWPGAPRAANISTYDDHRVAMSMAVVGLGGEGVTLDYPRCVEKTCPQFYELIAGLGARVTFE